MSAVVDRVVLPPMTGPQIDFIEATDRYVDFEGSPRSAKSWGAAFKIWRLALEHPGIQIFYCRYKDEDVHGQLRDLWAKVSTFFPEYLHPAWNGTVGSWDFTPSPDSPRAPEGQHYGSRVYMRSVKSADLAAVHSKYKGLTLAVVVCEEASEIPYVNYMGLKERLSQSRTPWGAPYDYPLQMALVHNSVDEDHWIAQEFPTDNTRHGYRHIRADLHSNRHNLGANVMAGYELDYPPGHPLRPTVVEGRRGVTLVGRPVYSGYFDRGLHVSPSVAFNPYYPLLEGWDFGHEKPAVVWWQYLAHLGAVQILGSVKGANLFIEDFAPTVLAVRDRWFPGAQVQSWCDPAGATTNGGTKHTPVQTLRDLHVPVRYEPHANDAEVRYAAVQVIAGYMQRLAGDGSPAFQMHPRCVEVVKKAGEITERETDLMVTAFEAGYIWDDRAPSDSMPNIRRPKKGTRYDDLMNAAEYVITGEQITVPQQAEMLRAAHRLELVARKQAQVQAQRVMARAGHSPHGETLEEAERRLAAFYRQHKPDHDPADRRRRPGFSGRRGGY